MAELDSLQIEINASSEKAYKQVDLLIERLAKLDTALSSLNTSGLTALANGVGQLGNSMKNLKGNVSSKDFTYLANNLNKIGNVKTSNFFTLANAMTSISAGAGKVSASTQSLYNFSSAIKTLGGSGITKAIGNIPALTGAVQGMMTSLSAAPAVSGNVIKMTNALANLAGQSTKAGTAAKALKNSLNAVKASQNATAKSTATVSSRLQSMSSVMNKSTKSTRSLSSSFGSFYANCFLLIRGAKAVGKAIEGSMDYVETFNYWNVTLGKIGKEFGGEFEKYGYDSAESYADSFSGRLKDLTSKMTGYSVGDKGELIQTDVKNLGVDPQKLMGYQANISAVTNSLGLCGETSVNTSKALSMLAVDMSSFKNVDLSTVMTNFQSGLIGQSRALYKYGIDITNATLQTYAYDHGIKQAVSTMTQADKMQLRLLAILDQSKVAWGDQANTISSVANQYRILKQQISNLARTIGNLFLPIVQKVLPVINGLVMALQKLFTILGFKAFGGDWLKDLQDGISSGSGGSNLDDLAGSADDVEDGLDNAAGSAKKLKGQLGGFHELNNLSSQSDSGSGASAPTGGGIDMSGAISDALGEYESVWDKALKDSENKAQEWVNQIEEIFNRVARALEPAREAFSKLWNDGLSKLSNFAWGTLRDFYYDFLVPVGKWMCGEGLPRFFSITNDLLNKINWGKLRTSLRGFYKELAKLAKFVFTALLDFYEKFLKPVAVWAMNKALPFLVDTISSLLEKIDWDRLNGALSAFWTVLSKFVVGIGQGIVSFFELLAPIVTSVLAGAINLCASALKLLFDALNMIPSSVLVAIGGALSGIVVSLGALSLYAKIPTVTAGLGAFFATLSAGFTHLLKAIELFIAFNGWIVAVGAALGILAVAFVEIRKSIEESALDSMFTALRDNGVTSLEALGNVAETQFGRITKGVDDTKEKIDAITETKDSIDSTVDNIEEIGAAIENGAYTAEEKIPEIITSFKSLLEQSKSIFEQEYAVIVGNMSGAWCDYLTAQGVAVPAAIAQLAAYRDGVNEALTSAQTDFDNLSEQFKNGEITAEEFNDKATPLIQTLSSFNSDGSIDSATSAIQNLGGALDLSQYIDGKSFDASAFQQYMDTVTQTATDGKNNLQTLGQENSKAMDDFQVKLEAIGIDASKYDWAALYGASDSQVAQGKEDINAAYQDYADQVQYCLMEQLPNVVEEATADYDKLNWYQKLFTTKEGYVQQAIDDFQNNTVMPISESIQGGFKQLGIDGEPWADEAAKKLSNSLFDTFTQYSYEGVPITTTTLKKNWEGILTDSLDGAAKAVDAESYGKNTVVGFNEGVSNNASTSVSRINEWMDGIDTGIHDSSMQYGSPSKTAWNYGMDTVVGFNNGIIENIASTIASITQWTTEIASAIKSGLGLSEESTGEISLFGGLAAQFEAQFSLFSESWGNNFDIWKSNNDSMYFGYNVWFTQLQNPLNAYKAVWKTFSTLWNTNMKTWWDATVLPYFTLLQWTEFGTSMKDGVLQGFKSIALEIGGVMNQVIDIFNQALKNIESAINDLIGDFNSMAIELGADELGKVSAKTIPHTKIPQFKNGGFPNTGELFMARENGITEMVGSMGGRAAVANNDQIVEGIQVGVAQANQETNSLLRELISAVRSGSTIEIGGTEVFNVVKDESEEYKKQYGEPAFA